MEHFLFAFVMAGQESLFLGMAQKQPVGMTIVSDCCYTNLVTLCECSVAPLSSSLITFLFLALTVDMSEFCQVALSLPNSGSGSSTAYLTQLVCVFVFPILKGV